MRKRLTEKFTKAKKGSLGYTLTEMLVVVGIIAALCAIAIPSIFAIRNALRFATANNYAKSIFLAAQQNLTELRSDGGLGPVRSADGAAEIPGAMTTFPDAYRSEYVYTVTGTEAFERVLPAGSIDAELRNDQIVIEYNPITGNVYSVFYFDKDAATLDLESQYESGALPREKSQRRELMVGYYDGSGLNSSQIELEQTQAIVEFINGEEGIVQVKVPMPESFYGNFSEFAQGLNVSLTLTGEWSMTQTSDPIQPLTLQVKTAGTQDGCTLAADGKTVVLSYVIDSLASRKSFVNFASGTQANEGGGAANSAVSLTTLVDERSFIYNILPGENITIQADVTFTGEGSELVQIEPGILSGVNPMFEYLQPSGNGGYVLAISNGRNLQNLNAIAPTIADMVNNVTFVSDIYWNDTVAYYNSKYGSGSTYHTGAMVSGSHVYDEAPARALPYFVPIHNEKLFGTARFIFPGDGDGGLGDIINDILNSLTGGLFGRYSASSTPTLTDEMDNRDGVSHASIQGNGHAVYNINIDSTKYQVPNEGKTGTVDVNGTPTEKNLTGTFYATGENQIVDYCFTGLFGYVNTPINSLSVVNPIVKGYKLEKTTTYVPQYILGFIPAGTKEVNQYNNPATGALLGAGGYNTLITDCSTYIDKNARGYMSLNWGPYTYDADSAQNWYGVSGTGAVGGLVGYAKSHRSVTGELTDDAAHVAFSKCFAAVPVSGEMRTNEDKNFGYSNGVGALIGNSQLTNFYNCYASGDVLATGCMVNKTTLGSLAGLLEIFGINLDLPYDGRTSWGAGGFVGTSHGTRYTNCFSTGEISAATASSTASSSRGAGGFVGFMSIDETFTYGNEDDPSSEDIAQRTVFTDCYSVGVAVTNGSNYENFSGANGRVAFEINTSMTYYVGDYFRLYAPHYVNQNGAAPSYEDVYIYRDTYFLSNYHTGTSGQDSSAHCASPDTYASFTDMVGNHEYGSQWMLDEIQEIKNIVLGTGRERDENNRWQEVTYTYDTEYFQVEPELNRIYQELYAEGYSDDEWESATASTTHPYSLTEGNRYPFTKLKGMDYYGDWPSKPSDVGLAYYETYEDTDKTHYFFDQDHTDYESLTLRSDSNAIVKKDGYSIFSADDSDLRVTIGNVTDVLQAETETYTVAQKTYHVFHLSDELLAVLPEDGEFYVKVTASHETSSDTYTMYYNPNVGLSHVNPVEGKLAAVEPDKAPTTIYVRSARQFKGIATLEGFWGEDTRYIQQLNIDASVYEWADEAAGVKLTAIGADGEDTCFDADYSAGYTLDIGDEQRFKIAGFTSADLAMFGAIGENGSVSNLIIQCEDFTAGSDKAENAAILAAVNRGEITKVDIIISGDAALTATTNAGLLAGLTTGNITECAVMPAEDATINVTVNAQNAGGLIGCVEGTAATGDAEAELVTVNKASVTVNGVLTLNGGAGNAGGLIGKASYMSAEDLSVSLSSLTGDSLYMGGLAGYVSNSSITGVVADDNGNNPVEIAVNSVASGNADGYAAGGLGYAEHTTLTAMDVTTGSVSGNIAAGFLGNSLDVDATNCDIIVTGSITGTNGAAGVAGVVGPQSVINDVPVRLSGVTLSGADAAGYALEVKGDAYVMGNSHVTLGSDAQTKTTISATGNAAGFAVTTAGSIGESNVVGFGAISGDQAAGYAINVSGNIASCHVSPALANENYLGNANANLAVSGKTAAAGFAMTVAKDSTIANSYTLCSITAEGKVTTEGDNPVEVTAAYGFVGTNNGTLNRCMNNVDIGDGYAFVGVNEGLVTTSYGWFGDGDRNNATLTKNEMTGSGKCYSSYFADLAPVNRTDAVVALYNADGNVSQITPSALQMAELAGFVGGYNEYPYQEMDESEVEYPYPMLRDHYGNWITPPQYAYGVAYYETYEDENGAITRKLQMVDLSNPALTEEGQKGVTFINDTFDNTGTIVEAGYAKFYNNQMGEMDGKTFDVQIGDFTFDFYKIESTGVETIEATKSGTKSAEVDTRFALAIKTDEAFGENETFQVRTADQLANIGKVAANFSQTHDIATTDVTSATIAANHVYNGNGLKLDITGQTNAWLTSVGGTVQDLNLSVDAVAAKVFDNVSGTVNNLNLTIEGAVSAPVFDNVSGTVNVNLQKLGSIAANGALVGTTSGSFTTGDIAPSEIAADGAIIGNVTGGTVTVGAINTGAVNGKVVASVSDGTVTTGAISTGDVTGAVFGAVSGGTVNVASISTNGKAVSGNIFASTAGNVSVTDGITAGDVSGAVFGAVSGGSVSTKNIQVDALTGKIFGDINANVTVSEGVTVTESIGTADNWLISSVKGGEINLGNIQAVKEVITTNEETDEQGKVTKTKTTKAEPVPGMIGEVSGGNLTLHYVILGNVTGVDNWLIDSVSNENTTVTVDGVTVNTKTTTEVTTVDPDTQVETTGATTTTREPVSNMIGAISGGSVTGSTVTLDGADITGNLFSGVSNNGILRGFAVSDAGSMGASLIGSVSGTIDDVDVTAKSVASGFGSSGLLVNTLSDGATVTDCDVVVKSAVDVSAATFGGITGTANAALSGNTVSATFNVTGESAIVGGLVGEMTGGSISSSTANGSITLASGSGDGKTYIVGGAVGKAGAGTSYSNVTANAVVDSTWGKPAFHNAEDLSDAAKAIVSPNANGPVGQFVGYVDTGASFDKCYGYGGSGYSFLGQVKHTSAETFGANTYGEFDEPWGSNTYREADQTKYEAAKVQYNKAGVTIANFDITLTDCYYMQGTASYQQLINNTKYYSDGTEGTLTQYQATKVNDTVTFTGDANLTVSSFSAYTSQALTNWYYLSDGKYYPVWASYEHTDRLLVEYYGVQLWTDANLDGSLERFVNVSGSDFGNTDKNKKIDVTLYQRSALNLDDGQYMIVGSDTHALMGSGAATGMATSFTDKNQDLVTAVWTKQGNTWSQGSNYLNLSNALVANSANNIANGVASAGSNDLAVTLNGGKYLTYSNSSFGYGNSIIGRINLYSVNSTFLYEMTFTNDRRGQIIASVPLAAASTVSEVSEDAEPVVVETEVTEATESQVTE